MCNLIMDARLICCSLLSSGMFVHMLYILLYCVLNLRSTGLVLVKLLSCIYSNPF